MSDTKSPARTPRFVPNGPPLTDEQIAIQTANARIGIAMANAGTGKTTTLVARIGEAIACGTPPEQILALTFTATAAEVLRTRLQRSGIHADLQKRVQVVTFDDYSHAVLERLPTANERARRIQRDSFLTSHIADAMQMLRDDIGHRHASGAFDDNHVNVAQNIEAMRKLKASGALFDDVDDEQLDAYLERLDITRAQYAVTQAYERDRMGSIDEPLFRDRFDATYDLAQLIGRDGVASQYFPPCRLIVCDEQHDFNEASYRVLRHLLRTLDCHFVGVGDRDQVIHGAMGASDIYMGERFQRDFAGTVAYRLTQTFRHGPHIAYPVAAFKRKTVESFVRRHTPIEINTADGAQDAVALGVLDDVRHWLQESAKRSTCAVLLRDWHQSAAIEEALWRAQIPFESPNKEGFQFREEIRFVRAVFALALRAHERIDERERMSVAAVLGIFANIRLTRDQYQLTAKHPELIEQIYTSYLLGAAQESAAANVGRLIRELRASASTISASDAFRHIRQRIDFQAVATRLYARPYDVDLVERSLRAFAATLPQDDTPLGDYFAAMMTRLSAMRRTRTDARVSVDTVTNIKGREFDHVIIPFLERNEFPNPFAPLESEKNLFYVALTRARESITLITQKDVTRQSGFIGSLDLLQTTHLADDALVRNMAMPADAGPVRRYLSGDTYNARDELTSLGARYDAARRQVYITSDMDPEPFSPWLRTPAMRRE
ncbi:UvrD-helicase domain-containing protein [Pandoraea sp. NPDC087047]|uniref:UvrD-helicase domain-containing protein n=1 Tax=Pandoraea sp. NPDC087047 TaxID=3364390 RepID=UPI00382E1C45